MYYAYESDDGVFVLRRQCFTECNWELLFNGRFVDSYDCPAAAARDLARHCIGLGIGDSLRLPPQQLSGWEVHWWTRYAGPAQELWLHRLYLEGLRARCAPAGRPARAQAPAASEGHQRRR